MNPAISRVAVCAFALALLAWPAGQSVSAQPAAQTANVELTSSGQKGLITADVANGHGEQVAFVARANPLPKGARIVVIRVKPTKRLLIPCGVDVNPCIGGTDTSDTATSPPFEYRAAIFVRNPATGKFKAIQPSSNTVSVEWKELRVLPLLKPAFGLGVEGSGFRAVFGVPLVVTGLQFQGGISTAWKSAKLSWDASAAPYKCGPNGDGACTEIKACKLAKGNCNLGAGFNLPEVFGSGSPPTDVPANLKLEMINVGKVALKTEMYPITYKAWNVSLSANGGKGGGPSVTLKNTDTATVTAKLTDPGNPSSSDYTGFVIRKTTEQPDTPRADPKNSDCKANGLSEKAPVLCDCPNDQLPTCVTEVKGTSSNLSSDATTPLPLVAEVYKKISGARPTLGLSTEVKVYKDCSSKEARRAPGSRPAQSCPAPIDYNIIYYITGGSGNCTPPATQTGPLKGLDSCEPGLGGTVEVKAWATSRTQVKNDAGFFVPVDTPVAMPSGWHVEWNLEPDPATGSNSLYNCGSDARSGTNRYANPCTLTLKSDKKWNMQIEASINGDDSLVKADPKDFHKLNVFWISPELLRVSLW